MTVPSSQVRVLPFRTRVGFVLLFVSVLLSVLGLLGGLLCVLLFLGSDDFMWLSLAGDGVGVWLGLGLLNNHVMQHGGG